MFGRNLKSLLLITGLISLYACRQDDFSKLNVDNWDPEFALPLIDSRFDLDRILSKFDTSGYLTTDDQNVVTLVYQGKLFEVQASKVLKLENVSFDLKQLKGELKVPFTKMRVKTIELKSGVLNVHVEHTRKFDVSVTLTMAENKLNNVPFHKTFIVPYQGGNVSVLDTAFDLSGYILNFSGPSGNETNQMNMDYTAVNASTNAPAPLTKFYTTFNGMQYAFLDGHLGEIDFGNVSDSLRITLFDKFKSGTLLLEDPKFELRFLNSFGMPVSASFGNFTGIGPGGTTSLSGTPVSQGVTVSAPVNRTGSPVLTTSEFNKNNSNVKSFIAISPKTINFNFGLVANRQSDTNAYNFAFDTSKVRGDIDLQFPFKGSIDSVIIEDDYEFQAQDFKNVKVALFSLHTLNAFPLGIYFQVYFIDHAGEKVDSLILNGDVILREAYTDVNGFSIKPALAENKIAVGELRFREVTRRSSHIRIRAMLLTSDSDIKNIRITADNYFHFKIGVRAVLTYSD